MITGRYRAMPQVGARRILMNSPRSPRMLYDSHCHRDPEGIHEVIMDDSKYLCETCGYLAQYVGAENVWVVTRPHLVFEEP